MIILYADNEHKCVMENLKKKPPDYSNYITCYA